MAKRPTIVPVIVPGASATLNQNFESIAQKFDEVLSRDGSVPNQMEADLDLNSNDIINVDNLTVNGELVYKGESLTTTFQEIDQARDEAIAAANEAEGFANEAEVDANRAEVAADQAENTANSLGYRIFETLSQAEGANIAPLTDLVTIIEEEDSSYVRADSEPNHNRKFQDSSGQWWGKLNTHAVSILEFGEYPGKDVDSSLMIQRALNFLQNSQFNRGQSLDLCGLQWGIASGLQMPRYCELKNGELIALGDRALWGADYMIQGKGGHGNWRVNNLTIDAGSVANGVRIAGGSDAFFVAVNGYKDYGWFYDGGGCKMLFCGATKDHPSRNADRTNKNFLSEGWGLWADRGDGKFTNFVTRGRLGVPSTGHHLLFTNIHCFMGTAVADDILGSDLVANAHTTAWTLAEPTDQFVNLNGSTLNYGTDYTVSLDASGFPTFTFIVSVQPADKIHIEARLEDVTAWEIRGGNNTFQGCYFDNGYIDIYNMANNTFQGVQLYNTQNVKLTAQVRLWATSANQRLEDISWEVGPQDAGTLPTFKLMAEPGASWAAGSEVVEQHQRVDFGRYPRLFHVGNTTQPLAAHFRSDNPSGRTYIRFTDVSTTLNNISVGSFGDEFEVQVGSLARLRMDNSNSVYNPQKPFAISDAYRATAEGSWYTSDTAVGIVGYGQSQMGLNGNNGRLARFTTAPLPDRVMSINDGHNVQGLRAFPPSGPVTGMTNAREQESDAQSIVGPMAWRHTYLDLRTGRPATVFTRTEAKGGFSIEKLAPSDFPWFVDDGPGTQPYENWLYTVQGFHDMAAARGQDFELVAIPWCQGFSNGGDPYQQYKDRLNELITRMQNDAMAITGQLRRPQFLIMQTPSHENGGQWELMQAQADICRERHDCTLVGAGWALPQHDYTHFTNEACVAAGELFQIALDAAIRGVPYSAPYIIPSSVTRNGTTITGQIGGNYRVRNETGIVTKRHYLSDLVTPVPFFGFEYVGGAAVTDAVLHPDGRSFTVTLDTDAAGRLWYAGHLGSRKLDPGDPNTNESVNRGTLIADEEIPQVYSTERLTLGLATFFKDL